MKAGNELLAHFFCKHVIGDPKKLRLQLEAFMAADKSKIRTHFAAEDDPSLPPTTMKDPNNLELTPEPSPVSSGDHHDQPQPWVKVTEHAGQACFIMPVGALVELATVVAKHDFYFPLWSGLELVERFGFEECIDGRWIQAQLENWRPPYVCTETEFYAVRYEAKCLRFQIVPGNYEDARQQIEDGIVINPTRYRRLPGGVRPLTP